jgi:hypothetical protein
MLESIKKISNPLTIIAIFSGLAEVSGTVVLPFLKDDSQSPYVWFLIAFPTLLILLFFVTLNFNYKVLYAPSDFKDEDNFLKLFGKPTAEERLLKLNTEIEIEEAPQKPGGTIEAKADLKYRDVIRRNSASTHYLAEELVITKLSQEFDEIDKEVMLRSGKSQFLFDAIAKKGKKVFAVEVKYLKDAQSLKNVRSSLVKIQRTLQELPVDVVEPMTVVMAIATDLTGHELEGFKEEIDRSFSSVKFPYEVRVFNLSHLEAELLGE